MKTALIIGSKIRITFGYDPRLVEVMHSLRGSYFSRENGAPGWTCPNIPSNRGILARYFPPIGTGKAPIELGPRPLPKRVVDLNLVKADQIPVKGLYPFQVEGVSFLESVKGRGLIADEPGLGKTIEAIGWLSLHPELCPVLVICPGAVKPYWARSIRNWLKTKSVEVKWGETIALDNCRVADFVVINYDILRHWINWVKMDLDPRVIILDEIHYIKNRSAYRTQAVQRISKGVRNIIGLSGTPILNRPDDLHNPVSLIRPGLLPPWWDFAMRYCKPKFNGFGWDFTGATNTEELKEILERTVMLRRLKIEVMKDLPPKTRAVVPMRMDKGNTYKQAEDDFVQWVEDNDPKGENPALKMEVEALKQIAVHAKLNSVIDWVKDFLSTGEKLVLFCTHRAVASILMEAFGPVAVRFTGETSPKRRELAIEKFQTPGGKTRLFVANILAGGVGITLTEASNTAFVELDWTPAMHDQAEDRVHRIGQTKPVTAWYLLAEDTIEERIAKVLDKKRKIINSVIGSGDATSETLTSLIREIRNER